MKNVLLLVSLSISSSFASAWAQEKLDAAEFIPYQSCVQEALRDKPELWPVLDAFSSDNPGYQLTDARESSQKLSTTCTDSPYGRVGLDSLVPLLTSIPQTTRAYLYANEKERELLLRDLTACTVRTEELHKAAIQASEAAYDLQAPPGYHLVHAFADKKSGFTATVLEPDSLPPGAPQHRIIAIAGTENMKDVHADLAFGRSQYKADLRQVLAWADQYIRSTGDVIFTGHSLGGGLAQAFAYATEENLRQSDPSGMKTVGKIHIATWNAFGGKELISVSGSGASPGKPRLHVSTYMPHVAEAINYRMQGDPVSLLGTHIGEVRTIPAPKIVGELPQFEYQPGSLQLHRLHYLTEAADRGELKFAVPTSEERKGLTGITSKALTRAAQADALGHWLGEETISLAEHPLKRISRIKVSQITR